VSNFWQAREVVTGYTLTLWDWEGWFCLRAFWEIGGGLSMLVHSEIKYAINSARKASRLSIALKTRANMP